MANVLLDHNNDFYKPYSETLYNKDHRSTHKKIRYLKPVIHESTSGTSYAKHSGEAKHEHAKKVQHHLYKDPISLGIGAGFNWIPPLDDGKDIVRAKWPQERKVLPAKIEKIGPRLDESKDEMLLRKVYESETKESQKWGQLEQQNKPFYVQEKLESCYDPFRSPYRCNFKVDNWYELKAKWENFRLQPHDENIYVKQTEYADPLMKFALKKSPVVELRQKAFKKSTENSQGFKVNYESRSKNLPDKFGNVHLTPQKIDYLRGLDDPRVDVLNRTYRTFPVDIVRDRQFVRDLEVQPRTRLYNFRYKSDPFKKSGRQAHSDLSRLKYTDPIHPVTTETGKYYRTRV